MSSKKQPHFLALVFLVDDSLLQMHSAVGGGDFFCGPINPGPAHPAESHRRSNSRNQISYCNKRQYKKLRACNKAFDIKNACKKGLSFVEVIIRLTAMKMA